LFTYPASCSLVSTKLPFSSSSRGSHFDRTVKRIVPCHGQTLIHTPRRMPHSKLSNLAPHEAILHRKLATLVFLEYLGHWPTNLVVSLIRDELDTFGREIGIPLVYGPIIISREKNFIFQFYKKILSVITVLKREYIYIYIYTLMENGIIYILQLSFLFTFNCISILIVN